KDILISESRIMMDIYFKSIDHKQDFQFLMQLLGLQTIDDNIEYGVFAYVIAGIGKTDKLAPFIEKNNIEFLDIYEQMKVFSESEKNIIHFAEQCFNGNNIVPLIDVMQPLDKQNSDMINQTIDIRYLGVVNLNNQ